MISFLFLFGFLKMFSKPRNNTKIPIIARKYSEILLGAVDIYIEREREKEGVRV